MIGCLSFNIAAIKRGMTAEYCELASCRGPNTLKYRNAIVSNPYILENTPQYCSPASFETAYGESGFGIIPSCLGNSGLSPYTEEEEANTMRFTFASFATSRRFSVPDTFTSLEVIGSRTERGTEGSAA